MANITDLAKIFNVKDKQTLKALEGAFDAAIAGNPSGGGGGVQSVSGVITSAQILTGFDTPVEILPAPGVGKVYLVKDAYFLNVQNTTRYDVTQDSVSIRIGTVGLISDSTFLSRVSPNLLTTISASGSGNNGPWNYSNMVNSNVNIQFGTNANPLTGDDDVKYYIEYSIVDFDAIT